MDFERISEATEAFKRTFPHLSDSEGIAHVWVKAVEWADETNELVRAVKKCLGTGKQEVNLDELKGEDV